MNKFIQNTNLLSSPKNNLYPNLDNYHTKRSSATKNTYVDYNNQQQFLHSKNKKFKEIYELKPIVSIMPLGLKNEGLFCWLNSSIKLLLTMLNIEDILLIRTISSKNPHKIINKIRHSFIYLWARYNNISDGNRDITEKHLNSAKIILINRFKQFVEEGSIESDGLKDYFLSKNPNQAQDCNLFIIAMRTILCLDNPKHNLKSCTYIDAICQLQEGSKNIIRKSSENPALIIKMPPDNNIDSINKYIEFLGIKESNTYHWSVKELLEQGIDITSSKNIPIYGNKFEIVEADLANLDSFIVYFSLPSTDKFSLINAHKKITNIVLSKNFPDDVINIFDTNDISKQYKVPVTIKAMICFSGHGAATHYICITMDNNKAIVHNDNRVYILDYDNNHMVKKKYNIKKQIIIFFHQHNFTPYSILYQKLPLNK